MTIKAAIRSRTKPRTNPKFPGFPDIAHDQCGMRLYDKKKLALVCTWKRDHSDARDPKVHDMTIDGKWWGGWVDRESEPGEDYQQYHRARATPEPSVEIGNASKGDDHE